jgi:hypothetical protein
LTCYDIIGDIHGQADKLEQLLRQLGYQEQAGVFTPGPNTTGAGDNQVVFLGDFIDRGPHNRRVIAIVRRMLEHGHALAVMGNHEFNAICYHTRDFVRGEPLRPHSAKNQRQHQRFLDEYPLGETQTQETISWFMTLPLFLELETGAGLLSDQVDDPKPQRGGQRSDCIRIVHACWDKPQIDYLIRRLGNPTRIDASFLQEANEPDSAAFVAIETLLKGPEVPLPEGAVFYDKDGHERRHIRYKWWGDGRTYREMAIVAEDQRLTIPDLPLASRHHRSNYPLEAPPVFFGHYWLSGKPQAQRHNIACLDYSAGKGGPLVAYQWLDGDSRLGAGCLRDDQFRSTKDPDTPE